MDKNKVRDYKKAKAIFWTAIPVLAVVLIAFTTFYFVGGFHSGCEDCFDLEGNLSAIKPSGHIVVDGQDYFISDWFTPNGDMPYYVNDYVGHQIHIDYVAGCGRRMITDIKIID